jgi:hypothetical protein
MLLKPGISESLKGSGYCWMRKKCCRYPVLILILLLAGCSLAAQDGSKMAVAHPGGISLRFGYGSYALKDHYISPERYDGALPYYETGWTRPHENYLYRLRFGFSQSGEISNYNVTTDVLNFKLSQGFLYPLKPLKLFKQDLGLWLGPTTDIFYYVNNPHIAVSGFDYTNSYAALFSLGFGGDAVYPLGESISVESSLQFSLLSVGLRTVDVEEDDQSEVLPLTLASGLNGSFDLGMRYDPLPWLSIRVSYRFELTRITAWEDVLSATDSGVLGILFRF